MLHRLQATKYILQFILFGKHINILEIKFEFKSNFEWLQANSPRSVSVYLF